MIKNAQTNSPVGDWRWPLTMGLAIGIGIPVARVVEANFLPGINPWGTIAINVVTAGLVGGVVASVANWLIRPARKNASNEHSAA